MARATDIGALTQSSRSAEYRALSQVGGAIKDTGGLIYKAAETRHEIWRDIEFSRITREAEEFKSGEGDILGSTPDEVFGRSDDKKNGQYIGDFKSRYIKWFSSNVDNISDYKLKSRLQIWFNNDVVDASNAARHVVLAKQGRYLKTETETNVEALAAAGEYDRAIEKIDYALSTGLVDEDWANRQRKMAQKVYAEFIKDGIKVSYQAVIDAGGSKQDAYKVIDAAYKDKVIDAATRETLGNNLDGYVRGRVEQARAAEKLTARQEYEQLIPQLFDPEMAQSRYDNVDKSRMSPKDKIKWFGDPEEGTKGYIAGTYEAAPIENTPKGHSESAATVFDAMSLQISPQEAYDELLTSRFIDKSITDEQFNWAIDKINNPYPQPVADALRTQLKVNLKTGWFDDEVDKDVNERLIAFVDDLVKKDKVPDFDLDKKLYAQSQKYRWGRNSGFEIGDVIDIDGTDWEVVGFDKSGEPLMEPVK